MSPHLLGRISPISPSFFLVFCAFSPSRRDGSNEPQAGTQGQETAGTRAKRGELPPSFDTPGAVGRITWRIQYWLNGDQEQIVTELFRTLVKIAASSAGVVTAVQHLGFCFEPTLSQPDEAFAVPFFALIR